MDDVLSIEDDKDKIIATINRVIEEIEELKDDLSSKRKDTEEIKDISIRLKQIELALKPKQKWFKEKIDSLDDALKELTEIRFSIMSNMKGKMFEIIHKNLLDGMYLEGVSDNFKNIVFNNVEVGNIEVVEDNTLEIKIRVNVYENTDEFEVHDPCRMYSIISFINTKFNYKLTNTKEI
ncbi:hypothetical protein [Desulfosporosinus sp.]|uniref:hypothetical protein n=1 Tax=Desulfosporosinus sp. TaxID=157907 RepID=UPI0025BF80DE|nr:hypothetical protein [Desulfosporosinus sp.]MBC2727115.1 hypothetical protein [Desulfosporosinus sp.]